jgi:hypothetical protein
MWADPRGAAVASGVPQGRLNRHARDRESPLCDIEKGGCGSVSFGMRAATSAGDACVKRRGMPGPSVVGQLHSNRCQASR